MAAAASGDSGTALRIHTREELGVDPDELPSPVLGFHIPQPLTRGRSGRALHSAGESS